MKYHLIGDQGVSMRGIRKYLESQKHIVTGSDLKTTGHSAENVPPDADVVVRTSAVSPGSPGWVEVIEAQKRGIKVIKRSELLGEISKGKKLIAISGMHGKTTVTAMVGLSMIEAGLNPTVLVGDLVKEFGDVIHIGDSDWFVMEACEYDRSFLDFWPEILILTNIDEEHLDTFPGGLAEIKEAFLEYVNHVADDGLIIACKDNQNIIDVLKQAKTKAKILYYGFSAEQYNQLDFKLKIPGKHNVQNALAVMALADAVKLDKEKVKKALQTFSGASRRFEFKGEYHGSPLIDDYGHHPTEISTTIAALKEKYPNKKKIVVFWPHQYKRIKPLINQFGTAFDGADEVIVKPIYFVPGRDKKLKVSAKDVADAINRSEKKIARFIRSDREIVRYLKSSLDKDTVLLTIGIPPVYKISDKILEKNNGRH